MSGVGRRVRALREARGLSQAALARAAGVERTWLIHLEQGKIRQPSVEKALALARALGVPVEALADDAAFERALRGLRENR